MGLKTWTEEQERYLSVNYPEVNNDVLAEHLGKSLTSVKTKATAMGLKKRSRIENYHIWTPADDTLIAEKYPKGDLQALADEIGVTVKKLYLRALLTGVKRDAEVMAAQNKRLGIALASKNLGKRFEKGQVSHNKGKRMEEFMSAEGIERTKKTRFTKGQKPHNTRPVGYERVSKDGYLEVKVQCGTDSKKNFEFKHRIEYRRHFGDIPAGMIVEFANGDKRDFSPENLILKTRAQNVRDNTLKDASIVKRFLKVKDEAEVQNIVKHHPEIIELKRNSLILNGAIRKFTDGPAKP